MIMGIMRTNAILREKDLKEGYVSVTMYGLALIAMTVTALTMTEESHRLYSIGVHDEKYFALQILICVLALASAWFVYQAFVANCCCGRTAGNLRRTLELQLLGIRIDLRYHNGLQQDDLTPGPTAAAFIAAGCSFMVFLWSVFEWLPSENVFGLSPTLLGILFLGASIAALVVAFLCADYDFPL